MFGVIGPTNNPTRATVAKKLRTTGKEPTVTTDLPSNTNDFTGLFLIGERAVSQCARTDTDCYLIPVDTLPLPGTLSPHHVPESINQIETNEFTLISLPTLTLTENNNSSITALFDILIAADQVAKIGTFNLQTDSIDTEFRADGVVLGTPISTHSYLHPLNTPIVHYDIDSIITVPLAEFSLEKTHWLFAPTTTVTIDILRAQHGITALIDGTITQSIETTDPLTITIDNHIPFLTFPTLETNSDH